MEYRKLGKSDLDISVITLGAWAYGSENFWGKVSEKDIRQVITKAVDGGINVIDTAIGYGDSEVLVGKAIKNFREKVIVASKGGADPRKVPHRVDLSLKRLGLDYIDLYQVHYPDIDIPIEYTMEAMDKIKKQGKIKYIGVSNFSVEQLKKAISVADVVSCQSAYNLMWREIEDKDIMKFCHKNNIGMLAYSPLGQGLFTGKFKSLDDIPKKGGDIRKINLLFKENAFEEGLKIVKILDKLSKKYNKTPAQIAINWVINQKGITSAIVGAKNVEQLTDNLGAVEWKMEKEDYGFLSSKGSKISKMFDYTYSMFGMKYDEVKIDEMIDNSL